MINKELLDYVRSQKAGKTPSAVIRTNLHMTGKWTDDEITQALISPETQLDIPTAQVEQAPVMASMPQSQIQTNFAPPQSVSGVPVTPLAPQNSTSSRKDLKIAVIILAVLLVIGGGYVAYGKLGFSSTNHYEESNLLSGLMKKYSHITSATYTSTVDITTSERDSDTKPFPVLTQDDSDSYYDYSYLSFVGSIHASMSATANWEDSNSDLKFNVSATGDMGDLVYKADIDGIRSGEDFYIKINNFPSLFLFDLSGLKNQWIKLTMDDVGFLPSNISELASEAEHENSKKEAKVLLVEFISILEENKFIKFSRNPKEEEVNGSKLIRYDLELNGSALVTAYSTMYEKYKNAESAIASGLFGDEYRLEVLQGDDFLKLFDYYLSSNGGVTIWTDASGNPALIEYTSTFVTEAEPDRQVEMSVEFAITDINKPVVVDAPDGAKSLEEVMESFWSSGPLGEARNKGNDTKVKANLAGLRMAAEMYYDTVNSYGIITNSCQAGMFADQRSGMYSYTDTKNYPLDTTISCHSNGNSYAVSASMSTGKYFCVDSRGVSKEINTPLKNGIYTCP